MKKFEYTVAIRTVGKAGDKYKKELESLHAQTVKPKRILVFLAEGFERPTFQVGYEEYIIVPKGLVHQRAASTQGVDTEFLLILDDDVYFPENSIEKMYEAMIHHQADGIAPDTFPTQSLPLTSKIIAYITNTVYGRQNDGWAIKIQKTGAFSYNNHPPKGAFLPTQSAAGTALFIKTTAFKNIQYADEQWIDKFPAGTFGEDQVMFYKLYRNGYKILMQYDSGVLHLDASTNKASEKTYQKIYYRAMSQYLTWHRTLYSLPNVSTTEKMALKAAYTYRFILGSITRALFALLKLKSRFFTAHVKGNIDAKKFVKGKEYKNLPSFIIK